MRAERLPVAEIVVAVDQRVPQLAAFGVLDRLEAERREIRQRRADVGLRVGFAGPDRLPLEEAPVLVPLRRQRRDPLPLRRLEHGHAGPDLAVAPGRLPVGVLADRLAKLRSAVAGKEGDGVPDLDDLVAGRAPA